MLWGASTTLRLYACMLYCGSMPAPICGTATRMQRQRLHDNMTSRRNRSGVCFVSCSSVIDERGAQDTRGQFCSKPHLAVQGAGLREAGQDGGGVASLVARRVMGRADTRSSLLVRACRLHRLRSCIEKVRLIPLVYQRAAVDTIVHQMQPPHRGCSCCPSWVPLLDVDFKKAFAGVLKTLPKCARVKQWVQQPYLALRHDDALLGRHFRLDDEVDVLVHGRIVLCQDDGEILQRQERSRSLDMLVT